VSADPDPRLRPRLRRRWWLLCLIAVPVAGLGIVIGIDRIFFPQPVSASIRACPFVPRASTRPELQRIIDGLVTGEGKEAPGATAYVSGPHGSWLGAAGVADTSTCSQMPVEGRMRLESVTKIYTAALILQLAQQGKLRLDETVARVVPGLLPYGNRITIRELLTMTSGLIDNNDFTNATDTEKRLYLARVKDPKLRAKLLATAKIVDEDPSAVVPATLWIRWAAWQPLLFEPGNGYHYSNIGYDILGLVAARAGRKPLPGLYRERIFRPLGLRATAYDPQGPISGPHAHGYGIEPDGTGADTTSWHWGISAGGGIVSDARDTAAFLTALMKGRLLHRANVDAMEGADLWLGGVPSGCAGQAYGWSGGGMGFKSEVWVDGTGSRVAILLLNARHLDTAQAGADMAAHSALEDLYCRA
jgi:D-alanyl-D-alanine carboxypeptidase